jgi:hypothetical protein
VKHIELEINSAVSDFISIHCVNDLVDYVLWPNFRFLDRLVNSLEEKKHHEVKLKDGLKDLATKRMELQNSLSSLWPKQVSSTCACLFYFR